MVKEMHNKLKEIRPTIERIKSYFHYINLLTRDVEIELNIIHGYLYRASSFTSVAFKKMNSDDDKIVIKNLLLAAIEDLHIAKLKCNYVDVVFLYDAWLHLNYPKLNPKEHRGDRRQKYMLIKIRDKEMMPKMYRKLKTKFSEIVTHNTSKGGKSKRQRKSKGRKTHKRKGAKKSHKRKHKKTNRRRHKSRKH